MSIEAIATLPLVTPLIEVVGGLQCGAKAVRLAEMQRLNFCVPEAIVVTGEAFARMLQQNDLRQFIDARVRQISVDDPQSTAQAAREIQAVVMKSELPSCIGDAVVSAATPLLANGPVAVRSSACGEDSGDAAFAGQLDSLLGIHTCEELLDALKRCWASYWSHRSLSYQVARNVKLKGMGVIIQHQIDAQFSGVLFTQDVQQPGSGEMLVEYCQGLGDALVSGRVCPRRLRITKSNWRTDESTSCNEPTAAIDEALVGKLLVVGEALEAHFEHPQDIEWTVDRSGQLHLLQSRPITALATISATTVWSNANVNENFPEPISPLLYSIASVGYYHYFRNLGLAFGISVDRIDRMEYPLRNIVGTHGGRLYYNLTNIHTVLRAAPCGKFLATAFNQFVGAGSTMTDADLPNWSSGRKGRLVEIGQMIRIATRTFGCLRHMARGVAIFERTVDSFAADSHPDRLPSLEWNELLGLWRRFMQIRCQWTDAAMADAASMISYGLSQRLLAGEFTDEVDRSIANRLLTGLCNIVSGLPTEHLWDLSRLVRQHESLVHGLSSQPCDKVWNQIETDDSLSDVRQALHQFLEQWGFRCSGELMLTTASYQENPATILDLLRVYVELDGESPRELLTRQQQICEQETERVMRVLRKKPLKWFLPWPRKDFLAKRLIRWTQRSVACRERARLKQALLYSRCRRLALTIGDAFVGKGWLSRVDDIFALTFDEIESILAGRYMLPEQISRLAELRRTAHERLGSLVPPDRIELQPGQYWLGNAAENDLIGADDTSVFRGTGVCGGSIVGRAVVLTDPRQFGQVASGDILVTRQTDPGWGPILFLVGGLVMERGGMLSHGAILAREYGIPSVVDVRDATRVIVTGNKIRVDGDRGIVEILDD
jgi:pyruvate,water dikinase